MEMKVSGNSGGFFRIKPKVWNLLKIYIKFNVMAIGMKI
jgi:hypothetical protein